MYKLVYVCCQDAQSGQEKSVKDEKMLDIIKERDQLQSQLSENDEQLGATRYRLKQTESELSKVNFTLCDDGCRS